MDLSTGRIFLKVQAEGFARKKTYLRHTSSSKQVLELEPLGSAFITVLDVGGKSVEGERVILLHLGEEISEKVSRTSDSGVAEIKNLKPGNYVAIAFGDQGELRATAALTIPNTGGEVSQKLSLAEAFPVSIAVEMVEEHLSKCKIHFLLGGLRIPAKRVEVLREANSLFQLNIIPAELELYLETPDGFFLANKASVVDASLHVNLKVGSSYFAGKNHSQ